MPDVKSNPLDEFMASVAATAGRNPQSMRTAVEDWFDLTMERTSGWYKRKVRLWLFGVGLALAVGLNADALYLVKTLWTDRDVRAALLASLPGHVPAAVPAAADAAAGSATWVAADSLILAFESLPVPLGYPACRACTPADRHWYSAFADYVRAHPVSAPLGWLLTAVAVSLGAPFWFDLLNKMVNLRGAGAKPKPAAASR